jgi:hypothetical protein
LAGSKLAFYRAQTNEMALYEAKLPTRKIEVKNNLGK